MMRKYFSLVLVVCLLFSIACASVDFDMSVFENNEALEVEIDEMDDTGTITAADGGISIFGTSTDDEDGMLMGDIDIRIIEDMPPVMRMTCLYIGEDWCFVDKFIVKTSKARYTFDVDRNTDVDNGKIYEMFTLVFTPESIGLIEDMLDDSNLLISYRMDGDDRDIDGTLMVLPQEKLQILYDAYIASGAMNNNFAALESGFPVIVKML